MSNKWSDAYRIGNLVLTAHPLATVFPRMTDEEWNEFFASVKANGLTEPEIVVDKKNRVIDGWHRTRGASEAGLPETAITLRVFEGTDEDAQQYVLDKNMHRRHLTTSQRAMIAAQLASMTRTEAANIKHGATQTVPTARQAAKSLNVSERQVAKAKTVLSKGTPAQVAAIKSGATTIGAVEAAINPPKRRQLPARPGGNAPTQQARRQEPHKQGIGMDQLATELDGLLGGVEKASAAAAAPAQQQNVPKAEGSTPPKAESAAESVANPDESLYDHYFREARQAITMMAVLGTRDKASMDVISYVDDNGLLDATLFEVKTLAAEHPVTH